MSGFWGMDTEQVRAHSGVCRQGARRIGELRDQLEGAVRSVEWVGEDAEAFRDRWSELASQRLAGIITEIDADAERLEGEADQQDVVSDRDGTEPASPDHPSSLPEKEVAPQNSGYRNEDNPWIPNWIEDPVEDFVSGAAEVASDVIGWGGNLLADGVQGAGELLGLDMSGFEGFRRDAAHLGETLTDWATGERVPTISELAAATLVTLGSGVGAGLDMAGFDSNFFDDRPGGIVHDVQSSDGPSPSPDTLKDLVLENNALRPAIPDGQPLEAGQVGVQEIRNSQGGDPVYIVQIPPTESDDMGSESAWGGQGNSRDWASNLRLVAGQQPAAMDDVRAAMEAAGIPPGSDVLLVGHSQGGIIGNHLSADPSFNNTSGAPGSYNVTHTFSVGSPVQTVVPAQSSTESVNVSHGLGIGPGGIAGDVIAMSDLGGLQPGGTHLDAPNRHEVSLPGYQTPSLNPVTILQHNHDSTGPGNNPDAGYAGTVGEHAQSDPVLRALQNDLQGVYLGDGTYVAQSHVVTVGREHRP